MFCPVCGAQATQGLNFCKRCGTNLTSPTGSSADKPEVIIKSPRVTGIFWAIAAFGMVGIFALMGAIITLAALHANGDAIFATALFGSAGIVIIVSLLLRYTSQYIKLAQNAAEPAKPKAMDTSPRLQIDPPPRAVSSVTEHTTRNFDSVPADWEARDHKS